MEVADFRKNPYVRTRQRTLPCRSMVDQQMASLSHRYWPVPLKGTSMEAALGSLEVISRAEVFVPVDEGLKVTLIVRVLPGLIVLLPLPLVILNMEASPPVMDVDIIEKLVMPLFVTVKEAVLLLFTFTFPKSSDVGMTEILGMFGLPLIVTDKPEDQFDKAKALTVSRALARTL